MKRYSLAKVKADVEAICKAHSKNEPVMLKQIDKIINKKKQPVYLVALAFGNISKDAVINTAKQIKTCLDSKDIDAIIMPLGPEDSKNGLLGFSIVNITKEN